MNAWDERTKAQNLDGARRCNADRRLRIFIGDLLFENEPHEGAKKIGRSAAIFGKIFESGDKAAERKSGEGNEPVQDEKPMVNERREAGEKHGKFFRKRREDDARRRIHAGGERHGRRYCAAVGRKEHGKP